MSESAPRVAVVGLGLIGGSLALGLRAGGAQVHGWDPDADTRVAAREVLPVPDDLVGCLTGAMAGVDPPDIVALAAPVDALPAVLAEVARRVPPHTPVFDVASVKAAPVAAATAAGLAGFVGAHPMAGTEESGFTAASADLLRGVTWALTPTEDTDPLALRGVLDLLVERLDARVAVVDPALHDEAVAQVSHLPHVLANALLAGLGGTRAPYLARSLAAGSFRDGTRVGGRDQARSGNMLAHNVEALRARVRDLQAQLEVLVTVLDDRAALGDWLAEAVTGRDLLDSSPPGTRTLPLDAPLHTLTALGAQGWLVTGRTEVEWTLTSGEPNRAYTR
ncbi:prephenate dehydrogenase [Nocardioides acrostichi]|uniref:Prephenate dehydrogenase/arogenate dehydrogenase family protein n=1 Tax=Nocardioides acrostichi TaxID=2784339 RepID=A0A930UZ39_9ACTN|nr:prephenate dehydrogenase/arogenate dehydrogenase family protein [Nocardioides acrostichi]MBF4162387.1 prephenate dehydrogenase/arogenate dehydrogenase family protein [Nocardioides acrostichi]